MRGIRDIRAAGLPKIGHVNKCERIHCEIRTSGPWRTNAPRVAGTHDVVLKRRIRGQRCATGHDPRILGRAGR